MISKRNTNTEIYNRIKCANCGKKLFDMFETKDGSASKCSCHNCGNVLMISQKDTAAAQRIENSRQSEIDEQIRSRASNLVNESVDKEVGK